VTWERCKRWVVLHPIAVNSMWMMIALVIAAAVNIALPGTGLTVLLLCFPLMGWAGYSQVVWRLRAGLKIPMLDMGLCYCVFVVMGVSLLLAPVLDVLYSMAYSTFDVSHGVFGLTPRAAGWLLGWIMVSVEATVAAVGFAIAMGMGMVIGMHRAEHQVDTGSWEKSVPLPEEDDA
jgi:hypothetical protein